MAKVTEMTRKHLKAVPTDERPRIKGEGLSLLLEILSWARPHGSSAERDFARQYLDTVPGMQADDFGNRFLVVGPPSPDILFSCHVDTVAARGGRQNIRWLDSETVGLNQGKPGMSLGADDGAGVWLCLQLIAAKVPGLYIFHRGEEVGGLGSSYIAKETPERLDGIKAAIAFDRMETGDVITHQACGRCCSDAFARSLAAILNSKGTGLFYRPDDTGTFTDTANYVDLVGECTNLSVGYGNNHGPREFLDVAHCLLLRDCLVRRFDAKLLTFERKPGDIDYDSWGGYNRYYTPPRKSGGGWDLDGDPNDAPPFSLSSDDDATGDRYSWEAGLHRMRADDDAKPGADDAAALALAVAEYPEVAASLLNDYGVTLDDFLDEVWKETGRTPYKPFN